MSKKAVQGRVKPSFLVVIGRRVKVVASYNEACRLARLHPNGRVLTRAGDGWRKSVADDE